MLFGLLPNWVAVSFFYILLLFCAKYQALKPENVEGFRGSATEKDTKFKAFASLPSFDETRMKYGPVVIVSTLDGKVSALDINNGGTLMWSMDIGQGPLMSSSISKLQIHQEGKIIRVIPSLSGRLYKFDGSSVEAVPFSAEQLLSSSFKISDDSILVGGKEITAFAIDSATGRILYLCSSAGCETVEEASPGANIIIVKRHQQTVRSIESRGGNENWNFTVGEVELDVTKGKPYQMLEHSGSGENENEHVEAGSSSNQRYYADGSDDDHSEHEETESGSTSQNKAHSFLQNVKVLVPEGVLCLFKPEEKSKLLWKHKFASPIANAWYVHNGAHHKIDLFDPNTVPALQERYGKTGHLDEPTIYIGFHNSQVYIQSSSITEELQNEIQAYQRQTSKFLTAVKFPYTPYLSASDRATEAALGQAEGGSVTVYGKAVRNKGCGNMLAMYPDKAQKDSGYYLKHLQPYQGLLRPSRKVGRATVEADASDSYSSEVVYSSIMLWWKEILILTVTTSIFVQCLIIKLTHLIKRPESDVYNTAPTTPPADVLQCDQKHTADAATSFESRFLQDFEPMQCLGRGGFGVVFESRNKVDDCKYAVKRIRLPNKLEAREKVMREVRALAKLEHPCIVRYFNAWMEEPPAGWQEQQDKELIPGDSSRSTQTQWKKVSKQLPESYEQPASQRRDWRSGKKDFDNTEPFSHGDTRHNELSLAGETGSFQIYNQNDLEGIGSFSQFDVPSKQSFAGESGSFSVRFEDSHGDASGAAPKYADVTRGHGHMKKFFQTNGGDSSFDEDSGLDAGNQHKIPFSSYMDGEDSSGVVFQLECDNHPEFESLSGEKLSADSPENAAQKAVIKAGGIEPENNQNTDERYTGANVIRQRKSSCKRPSADSSSELKSVVCMKNGEAGDKKRPEKTEDVKIHKTRYLYIQMQLCKKESLRIWLAQNRDRKMDYCLQIFKQVTSAVRYVHDRNLIHRDLKPSNIFFSFDGEIKVGDFGLVTETDERVPMGSLPGFDTDTMDQQGVGLHTEKVGTRMYMAPELMTSRAYTEKVDIFALGIIFVELLVPFGTEMERVRKLTDVRRREMGQFFYEKYENEAALVEGMLSLEASDRPTAHEVHDHHVLSRINTSH